ncbi:hypothetical protein E1281_31180 [Actinomadura sp. KC345]|uniref:hypothetical protein n=1 Tax=Actinomadura sp. KC345 TaxID=2530371 RepID=UPI00104C95FB|nr:hypothetical protein [Actinomadura sp. KC345]TDC45197.1 hypothetical protein E1281_31180 [Actinomadura sp. KC345]
MIHDMPDSRPTKTPDSRRNLVIVVVAAFAAAVLAVFGVIALTGADDDQPNSTGGSGSAETTVNYMFTAETETSLAKLEFTVGPSGQITGTHVWVRFNDDGEPFGEDDEEPFGGTFTDGHVELTGLSDTRSAYTGTLENGVLTLDGTFGVSATEWTQIQNAAEFDKAIRDHHAEPVECEDEGRFGCGES